MDKITEQDTSCLPEPLTHKNTDGEPYRRETAVDRQIQEALILDVEELARRSRVTDTDSHDYLQEESLVYLIRHHHKLGNRRVVNALSESLLRRCASWINNRFCSLGSDAAEEGYSEVVATLFCRILDLDSDQGDFLQVRFWVVLKSLTVQAFNRQLNQTKHERNGSQPASSKGYEIENVDAMSHERVVRARDTNSSRTIESEVTDKDTIRRALDHLQEPLRTVYVLRHYWGWPIEDQDPNTRTISQRFNKTPRTIRNWLAKAEKELEAWRQEENKDEYTG